jgi:hypothetical protein
MREGAPTSYAGYRIYFEPQARLRDLELMATLQAISEAHDNID